MGQDLEAEGFREEDRLGAGNMKITLFLLFLFVSLLLLVIYPVYKMVSKRCEGEYGKGWKYRIEKQVAVCVLDNEFRPLDDSVHLKQ